MTEINKEENHDFEISELGLGTCKKCGCHMTRPQFPPNCHSQLKEEDYRPCIYGNIPSNDSLECLHEEYKNVEGEIFAQCTKCGHKSYPSPIEASWAEEFYIILEKCRKGFITSNNLEGLHWVNKISAFLPLKSFIKEQIARAKNEGFAEGAMDCFQHIKQARQEERNQVLQSVISIAEGMKVKGVPESSDQFKYNIALDKLTDTLKSKLNIQMKDWTSRKIELLKIGVQITPSMERVIKGEMKLARLSERQSILEKVRGIERYYARGETFASGYNAALDQVEALLANPKEDNGTNN